MELMLALLTGLLYATAVYMMLRRSIVKLVIGLSLLAHASTLLILTVGRPVRTQPPIIPAGATELVQPFSDPVPQALILTAIVISFGVQAFALVLIRQSSKVVGTDDLDRMRGGDA
ncbi:MAG: mrpC [Bacteroidetes bacterium]|nr:mrpC [Bacteroidota bacterium]